jgi:hypothetical protein
MPIQKDLKRRIRARMRKTGESYTAARVRVLAQRRPSARTSPPPPVPPAPARSSWAELAGMSDAAVAKKTGKSWSEWVTELDRHSAASLEHRAIAKLLHETHELPAWWAQTVTVGYERIRGKRVQGQRSDGTFAATKSKVFPVPLAELWTAFVRCDRWLAEPRVRMRKASKHKVMRMRWTDGTPIEAVFAAKGEHKSQVQVQHDRLDSREAALRMRGYWEEKLARLAAVLKDGS